MDLTPASIRSLEITFSLRFQQGYEATPTWYSQIASDEPSGGAKNVYGWRARIAALRKWVGPRVIQAVTVYESEIVNDEFELTVGVERTAIEDDTFGIYSSLMMGIGEEDAQHPDVSVFGQIAAGRVTVCFDGQPFFALAHPIAPKFPSLGTYPNLYTGTPLTPQNFEKVVADFKSRVGEDGRPLKLGRKLLLVTGPRLEATAKAICKSTYLPSQLGVAVAGSAIQENMYVGMAEPLMIPEMATLGAGTDWMVVEVGKAVKPFIWQRRIESEFALLTSPTDPNVFMNKQLLFGVRRRDAAGVSLPFLASYCTPGS